MGTRETAPPFQIRPALDCDRAALIEQFQLLNQHEEPFSHNRRLDREGGEAALAEAERRVEQTAGVKLVAEHEGTIIGHLFLTFEEAPSYIREDQRRYANVKELFVREAFRGRGLGHALLLAAEAIAIQRGYSQLLVGVQKGNDIAERAYLRFGFVPYSMELLKQIGPASET